MYVCIDFAWEKKLEEWEGIADAHCVNKDVTWHFELRVDAYPNRGYSLPHKCKGWIVRWFKAICKFFVKLDEVKADTCHVRAKSFFDLLLYDLIRCQF